MEKEGDKCSAFVVEDGKFVYCGTDEEARALADEVVDLGGKTVLPGLIDHAPAPSIPRRATSSS